MAQRHAVADEGTYGSLPNRWNAIGLSIDAVYTTALDIASWLTLPWLGIKALALGLGVFRSFTKGKKLILLVRKGATQRRMRAEIRKLNLVEACIAQIRPPLLCRVVEVVFRGYVLIPAATALALAGGAQRRVPPFLVLAIGIAVALCAVLHLLIALMRPLMLGREAWRTPDVSVPHLPFTAEWDVHREPAANVSVYFLVLAGMAVAGFAALYSGIHAIDSKAFAISPTSSAFLWIYMSVTTIATVGFGDVTPHALGAQIAVTLQMLAGPVLLSWLIAVLLAR